MKEALYYIREGDKIRCELCPHRCLIEKGRYGVCRRRMNVEGKLIAEGYGQIAAMGMDPIEKKPLYHFHPGSNILSVGGLWCNFRCSFCQNWHIAHQNKQTVFIPPEQLVQIALKKRSIGIAFTYNEPVIWYEYIYDTARLAKDRGLLIVLITNGFIMSKPLVSLLPLVDAMNIDVKGFTEDYYKKVCGGSLSHVKATVEMVSEKCHVEVTTMIIGGLNDNPEEMNKLFKWLSGVNRDIPLHLSRYFPNYQMQIPPTSVDSLKLIWELSKKYLCYSYIGNVPGVDMNTYCPQCSRKLIERTYEGTHITGIKDNRCIQCDKLIPVIL